MDILGLLKRIEKQSIITVIGYEESCFDCRSDSPNHFEGCELKAAIDEMEAGRLVVVDKTAYNTRRVIRAMRLEKERKEKEQWT